MDRELGNARVHGNRTLASAMRIAGVGAKRADASDHAEQPRENLLQVMLPLLG